eukprot:760354-Prymnesium_polylepis.1
MGTRTHAGRNVTGIYQASFHGCAASTLSHTCSRLRTSLPGLKSKSRITRLTANFQGEQNPENGLARSETPQTPLPEHTHASQHQSRSQHGVGRTDRTQRRWSRWHKFPLDRSH